MSDMFSYSLKLTSLDLSNFDTSNVRDMSWMLTGCENITSIDLSSFDTSKVKDMHFMFYNCYNLTTIKGVIDMESCTNYFYMFHNCPKLRDVKIKNPPANFESASGLSKSQYIVVS